MMFIPSEAVFIEIQSNFSDLIDYAQKSKSLDCITQHISLHVNNDFNYWTKCRTSTKRQQNVT